MSVPVNAGETVAQVQTICVASGSSVSPYGFYLVTQLNPFDMVLLWAYIHAWANSGSERCRVINVPHASLVICSVLYLVHSSLLQDVSSEANNCYRPVNLLRIMEPEGSSLF